MAFWSRKRRDPAAELVRIIKEEPYIPKPRAVQVADWTVMYSNGTKIVVKATHMSDSQSMVYINTGSGNNWMFDNDSRVMVKEIFFYDTVWGESDKFGESTQRLVARVTSFDMRSVTSDNWREEERGVW